MNPYKWCRLGGGWVAVVKEGGDGDNPVVKADEDDGELINSRDRSWPDVLYYLHCIFYFQG
jgi:hypothetical protein